MYIKRFMYTQCDMQLKETPAAICENAFDEYGVPQIDDARPRWTIIRRITDKQDKAVFVAVDTKFSVVGLGGLGDKISLVAIKACQLSESTYKDLVRGARVAASMSHESIVKIFDVVVDKSNAYCIMEYLDPSEWVRADSESSTLNIATVLSLSSKLVDVIEYMENNNVVHADLQLRNIFISNDAQRIKLIDFDISSISLDQANKLEVAYFSKKPYHTDHLMLLNFILAGFGYVGREEVFDATDFFQEVDSGNIGRVSESVFIELQPIIRKLRQKAYFSVSEMVVDLNNCSFVASVGGIRTAKRSNNDAA